MKLITYLRDNAITQTAFAEQIGAPVSRVNEWVKGKGMPTLDRVAAIQKATDGAVGLDDWLSSPDHAAQ